MKNKSILISLILFVINIFVVRGETTISTNHQPHIAVLGDSMSFIGGENCEKPISWTYHFKNTVMPASINLYARSGATWTNTENTEVDIQGFSRILNDNNVIFNQVLRLGHDLENGDIVAPDIIIVYAGANDAWFESQRPGCKNSPESDLSNVSADDLPSERTTLRESVALSLKKLQEISPSSRLLIVTPVQMSKVTEKQVHEISDIIANTALELNCNVIRADNLVGISHDIEKAKPKYTTDGVHTNEAGAVLIADVISDYCLKNYFNNKGL